MTTKGANLTVEDLQDAMDAQCTVAHAQNAGAKKGNKDDAEVMFAAPNGGKTRHGGRNNRNGKSGGNRANLDCHFCGRVGHTKAKCWCNPENAHLRPAWFDPEKKPTEKTGIASIFNSSIHENWLPDGIIYCMH